MLLNTAVFWWSLCDSSGFLVVSRWSPHGLPLVVVVLVVLVVVVFLVVLVVVAMVVLVTISRGRCGSSTYCVCSPKLQTNSSLHP